ncbi:MAG: MauE/DoxX family redox-associated membrane protein [Solirubrobacteraceae bacterium]|nr:MauE/DoxX family redox-associated membrane protein [Solirubrobacteraceae bacterium]
MLLPTLLVALLSTTLLAAAALKAGDPTATAVAATTFGLRGAAARWAWLALALLEAGLAVALLAAAPWAPGATAAVLGVFALAQVLAIFAGRTGAPCGCFGARGRISWGSVARTAVLAGAAIALAIGWGARQQPPLLPAVAAIALAAAIVWRLRAARPAGALDVEGEGPPLGSAPALGDGVRLALFSAPGCHLCRALIPQARRLGASVFDEVADADAWARAEVPGAPYAVALAADGTVVAKGTVNTRTQLASVFGAAQAHDHGRGSGADGPVDAVAHQPERTSRRGFLATASAAVAVLTAGRLTGALVAPGDAEAYHFCGHIYTTDGCPHPTGLPRIDRHGYPLRAKDGKPVDDLGRLVDANGAPIDEAGAPLLDPDGRPMPPARRRRVCTAAGKRYRVEVRTDGAWYRCCDGRVRKLLDCCTTGSRRINGDRALRGYCYARRRVFCVMYFQTNVPC